MKNRTDSVISTTQKSASYSLNEHISDPPTESSTNATNNISVEEYSLHVYKTSNPESCYGDGFQTRLINEQTDTSIASKNVENLNPTSFTQLEFKNREMVSTHNKKQSNTEKTKAEMWEYKSTLAIPSSMKACNLQNSIKRRNSVACDTAVNIERRQPRVNTQTKLRKTQSLRNDATLNKQKSEVHYFREKVDRKTFGIKNVVGKATDRQECEQQNADQKNYSPQNTEYSTSVKILHRTQTYKERANKWHRFSGDICYGKENEEQVERKKYAWHRYSDVPVLAANNIFYETTTEKKQPMLQSKKSENAITVSDEIPVGKARQSDTVTQRSIKSVDSSSMFKPIPRKQFKEIPVKMRKVSLVNSGGTDILKAKRRDEHYWQGIENTNDENDKGYISRMLSFDSHVEQKNDSSTLVSLSHTDKIVSLSDEGFIHFDDQLSLIDTNIACVTKSFDDFLREIEMYDSSNKSSTVMLGISSANACRQRRFVSKDFLHNDVSRTTLPHYNGTDRTNQPRRRIKSCHEVGLSRQSFVYGRVFLVRSKSTGYLSNLERISEEEKYEERKKKSSLITLIERHENKDQNQRPPFLQKCKSKIIVNVNRGEIPYQKTMNRPSSPLSQGESSVDAMCRSEQDLGSDAESLPSCGDSYTASESPPNSPELLFQIKSVSDCTRRVSAPEALNIQTINALKRKEYDARQRRRNSSVEEGTRVRFQLEESFKEEEDRYKKQFEDVDEGENQYTDVEKYKQGASPTPQRKISSPSNLHTDKERRRKVSVFSDASKKSFDADTLGHINDNRKLSLQDINGKNRKLSYQELKKNSYRKSSLQNDRNLSLQDNKSASRKTSLQEKTTLQVNQLNATLQERKLSLQMQERKQSVDRKLSTGEKKNSSSERKISLTNTFRAVVGTRKKSEQRKNSSTDNPNISPDENNNTSDKKSTWGIIKNKMKKDRKISNDNSPGQSPRNSQVLSRNNSSSSIESGSFRKRSDSLSMRERFQKRSRSIDYDRRSSFASRDSDDAIQEVDRIVPKRSFEIWSDGKIDIDLNRTRTLPLIHVAAGEGNIELVKTLIDVGVDINELDDAGWPALHYAVCAGHFECAQLLMTKGSSLQTYSNRVMNSYCTAVRDSIRKSDIR